MHSMQGGTQATILEAPAAALSGPQALDPPCDRAGESGLDLPRRSRIAGRPALLTHPTRPEKNSSNHSCHSSHEFLDCVLWRESGIGSGFRIRTQTRARARLTLMMVDRCGNALPPVTAWRTAEGRAVGTREMLQRAETGCNRNLCHREVRLLQ